LAKLIFITGGARSGKSSLALRIGGQLPGPRAFVATLEPRDEEMAARREHHRRERGAEWQTFEEPLDVPGRLAAVSGYPVVVIDCLTLWLSNLLGSAQDPETAVSRLLPAARNSGATVILVANEVGMGIVPEKPLARRFRDLAGTMNQRVAAAADEVFLAVAGIPLMIKGPKV